ncbi:hypothetical protein ACE6H2_015969 [Prunus campanulata]
MRNKFLAMREFFDSTNSTTRDVAKQVYKGHWDRFFANEAEFAVMWHTKLTSHNPITSSKVHPVTEKQMMYEVKFVISKWMVDGHPINYLFYVRNCAEHDIHMESEAWFDLLVNGN